MADVPRDAAVNEFDRLRDLLLADDRAQHSQLAADLGQLQRQMAALPQVLPEAIDNAHQSGQRLSRSLLKPVAQALSNIARHQPQLLVSVLFPVMGPIIRRSIADALTSLMRNLNRTLELSLSARSWRWRIEAWRTGVPFAQVVLKHTLTYRIEHLLWIESGSGMLLAHSTNSEAAIADRDAIAGMLTAISDFVRDAVLARAGEELERVELGEFSVRLLRTPEAYLAAVVRGEPDAAVLDGLRRLSETLHTELAEPPRGYSDAAETRLTDWMAQSGKAEARRDSVGGRKPPWLALALVAVVLAWAGYRVYVMQQVRVHQRQLRLTLDSEPGIRVESLRLVDGRVEVTGARDPLTRTDAELAEALGVTASAFQTRWQTEISMDPEILARRLRKLLQPPASVQIAVGADGLELSGEWLQAPADLETRLDVFRSLLPVASDGLRRAPPAAALDRASLERELAGLRVNFSGDQPLGACDATAQEIAERLQQALALEPQLKFAVIGESDGTGGVQQNLELRQSRARWLMQVLLRAGVPESALELRSAEPAVEQKRDPAARRARVQIVSGQ